MKVTLDVSHEVVVRDLDTGVTKSYVVIRGTQKLIPAGMFGLGDPQEELTDREDPELAPVPVIHGVVPSEDDDLEVGVFSEVDPANPFGSQE